jgi:hypothetical protein
MQGLFNDLWANQDVISVNHVVDITLSVCCLIDILTPYCSLFGALQIALFVIGDAGMTFMLYFHFEISLSHL